MVMVSGRFRKAVISTGTFLVLSAALYMYQRAEPELYEVRSQESGYKVNSVVVSRGREHSMWDADPREMAVQRFLGRSAVTRRLRPKASTAMPCSTALPKYGQYHRLNTYQALYQLQARRSLFDGGI